MAERVEVRLNRVDIRNLSVRWAGRRVETVLKEIEQLSRLEARGPYSTGHLASTIHRVMWVQGSTVRGEVRAGAWYAHLVHDGAKAHIIRPRVQGRKLRFYWRKVGHTVTLDYVSHPGFQGKHFLSNPARIVGRRHRFIVITVD